MPRALSGTRAETAIARQMPMISRTWARRGGLCNSSGFGGDVAAISGTFQLGEFTMLPEQPR
jgi:hypothetical protein